MPEYKVSLSEITLINGLETAQTELARKIAGDTQSEMGEWTLDKISSVARLNDTILYTVIYRRGR